MSLATHVRLSLDLVFSGCFAAVFEEFHVQYAWGCRHEPLSRRRRVQEAMETPGGALQRGGWRPSKQGLSTLLSWRISESFNLVSQSLPNKSSIVTKSDYAARKQLPSSERPSQSCCFVFTSYVNEI